VRRLDRSRPITAAVSGGMLNDDCIADSIEICGINYQLPMHDPYHAKHPSVPVIAAETHSTFTTRGTYETAGHYHASYDEDAAPWGATARATWRHVSSRDYVAGLFAWTGFDYRGEPTPHGWPAVSSAFGIMDTCGFEKDAFYLHKAWWTAEPFVHVLPHWNWDAGREVRVMTYANCDEVELFLNGEPLGRKAIDPIDMAMWRMPYRPGQLRAVGYRDGRVVAEKIVETTGPAVALGLEVHPSAPADVIPADGACALPITVFALDAQGRRVPTADDHVTFTLDGPAKILGVGNGDPTCHEPDMASSRSLFRGLAQVIVQTSTTPGEIMVIATAPNRAPAALTLTSSPAPIRPAAAPARRRILLTDWRMSPITNDRPDVKQEGAAQDMNSWEHITPGQPQTAWQTTSGYAIYRTTFTVPKGLQTRGGSLLFHGVVGEAEMFIDGALAPLDNQRIVFLPSAAPLVLTVVLRGVGSGSGLTGPVELR
jgi:beta-galactosidase